MTSVIRAHCDCGEKSYRKEVFGAIQIGPTDESYLLDVDSEMDDSGTIQTMIIKTGRK